MSSPGPALPALHATGECAAAQVPWRHPAGPRLTIVAKITFRLVEGQLGVGHLLPPGVVHARDLHVDRSPLRGLEAPGDLAPALPRAEILLTGVACATGGVATPATTVQLQVARSEVILRKRAHVLGDRARHGEPPRPFRTMPIEWERSVKSETNPLGVSPTSRGANWIDTADPTRTIGFGAIPALWPSRRAKLGDVPASTVEAAIPELPPELDWTYFQAAPDDQQLDALAGDEWIALDGLHPVLPRLSFRLPGRRAAAKLVHPSGRVLFTRDLVPDRLLIDTVAQVATLSYRGVLAADWQFLDGFRVEVGSGPLGGELTYPDAADPATRRATPERPETSTGVPLSETRSANVEGAPAAAPTLPFAPSARGDGKPPAAPTALMPHPDQPPRAATLPFAPRRGTDGPPPARRSSDASDPDPALAGRPGQTAPPPAGVGSGAVTPPPVAFPAPPPVGIAAPPPHLPPPPFAGPPPAPPDDDDGGGGRTRAVDVRALLQDSMPFAASDASRLESPARAPDFGGLPFQAPPGSRAEAEPPTDEPTTELPVDVPHGDKIPMRTDGRFQLASITWQSAPSQEQLVLVVKATFGLAHGQTSALSPEPALPVGDVFADDDIEGPLVHASDFAPLKPKVDVLVTGRAHAPGGKATAMQVVVRLRGARVAFTRELAVFGDRTWQRALVATAPTAPATFESIPITWERSFGGPAVRDNPSGVGHKAEPGRDGLARLPNFELPAKLIKSPDDTPPPAGLGPIHPLWPMRWSLLGTYDAHWFKTRWPSYAADMDPTYFQAAPAAQRLDALDGDEEFELVGLHPLHGTLRGRLPGVRPRAFVQRTIAAGRGFEEVPLRLDTLTFEPDADAGHLVWRGRLDVSDDDAPEIDEIFVTTEPLAGPALTLAEAKARHEATRADDAPPPPTPPAPPAADEPDPDAEADAAAEKAVLDRVAKMEAEIAAKAPPAPTEPDPLPAADPVAIEKILREGGASPEDTAELLAALRPHSETEPPPSPPIDLRAFVLARMAAGEPLSELDLRGADLSDLDLHGQSLQASHLGGAKLDRADLRGVDATEARLVATRFHSANLEGAKLDGADLTDADFTGALLVGASLCGAEGEGAKLIDADLRGAKLDDATLHAGDWSRANAEGLVGAGLDLSRCKLDRARFTEAKLPAVRLYDTRGVEATFDRADLTNARVGAAVLRNCSFRDVAAKESVWERADLTTSTFQGADLAQAGFTRVTAMKTNFNECDLTSARFRKAKLDGAMFVRANLMEADLEKASLELADLRGANLHAAFVHRTALKHAKLDDAITTQTLLGRR